MAQVEPSVALVQLERALRRVMQHAYREQFKDAWLERISTDQQRACWAERATEEEKKRTKRGAAVTPSTGLEYAHLAELRSILKKQWSPVAPALGAHREVGRMLERAADVEALLKRFDDLRNTVAHSRDLLPFEKDLLAGIAGDIENRVTIYMSSKDNSGDYYPRITALFDSLGHEPTDEELAEKTHVWGFPEITLRPGDTVTFTCRGHDPQGRQIEWAIMQSHRAFAWDGSNGLDRAVGDDVTLIWKVQRDDTREQCDTGVAMRAADSEFHRAGSLDQAVMFQYQVLPPAD